MQNSSEDMYNNNKNKFKIEEHRRSYYKTLKPLKNIIVIRNTETNLNRQQDILLQNTWGEKVKEYIHRRKRSKSNWIYRRIVHKIWDIKYADIIHTNIIMHIFGDYSSKKLKKKYIGKQLPLPTGIITTI
jgi:hypothetical protein